ncbi:unnamed protein product [Auanema sp. JU1783]|nr:unnamed protein product [Auanema sp. JU1783]
MALLTAPFIGERETHGWVVSKADEYQQVSLLGKGAYGHVYLVNHMPTGRQFALKKIQVTVNEEGVPQSVLREIATMKSFHRLYHKNVLRMHDVFHYVDSNDPSFLFINMVIEKCDWDLYTFLKEIPKDMPEHQSRFIARQILEGVDYLHSMNIIHRDLKPQNVLINRDQTIKIADFGLSRCYGSQSTFTTVVVTLWYRSPELLLQCKYNTAVDIWAVGCILSELYARQPLFPGGTESQQLNIIFQKMGTPRTSQWPLDAIIDRSFYASYPENDIRRLNPRLTPDAADLVKKCLTFCPQQRIAACDALKEPYFLKGNDIKRSM